LPQRVLFIGLWFLKDGGGFLSRMKFWVGIGVLLTVVDVSDERIDVGLNAVGG